MVWRKDWEKIGKSFEKRRIARRLGKHRKILSRKLFKFDPELRLHSRVISPRTRREMSQARVEEEFGKGEWDIGTMESECFENIAYSPKREVLQLRFKRNVGQKDYLYFGVPFERFEDFMRASSKGRYYNIYIKGQYDVQRV